MTTKTLLTATALAGILTLAAQTTPAEAAKLEKCYGVAKAGENDCHHPAHSCAGLGTVDGDPAEYVMMPTGLCEKLVNGSLTAGEPAMKAEAAKAEDGRDHDHGHQHKTAE